MKKANKKTIVALFITSAVLIIAAVLLCIIFRREKTAENAVLSDSASDDTQSVFAGIPDDHISDDKNKNVFSISQLASDDNTVTVQLSLNGNISICRYSATVVFDSDCLELSDYDSELSVYSPVVYPGKDDNGRISEVPEGGIVNLEWANASNLTKEGEIIKLVFNKTADFSGSTKIGLNIKGVNTFKDDIVVETEYNAKGLVVNSK